MAKYLKTALTSMLLLGVTACGGADIDNKPSPNASVLYADLCASCHGADLSGGMAPSLLDDIWLANGTDAALASVVKNGIINAGMPAFGGTLSDDDIADLVKYIRQSAHTMADIRSITDQKVVAVTDVPDLTDDVIVQDYTLNIEEPWGFSFLPDGQMLVTEKSGQLLLISAEGQKKQISGTPEVFTFQQGGLLDVAIDPEYGANGWMYLSFAHASPDNPDQAMTRVVRGRLVNDEWIDNEVVFEMPFDTYVEGGRHFGGRLSFSDDGYLFVSVGDRGVRSTAQDLSNPAGKIHRIYPDGSIPETNPFADDSNKVASIYSYGNRNPQGLVWDDQRSLLWETEHGPKGGDELNLIQSSVNYGWPLISYGKNYDGTSFTDFTSKPGMAQPLSHWTPSIAVSGLDVYYGTEFPEWTGKILAGSLANESVRLISISDEKYMSEAIILKGQGRIRQVKTGPDGAIYVAVQDRILKLTSR